MKKNGSTDVDSTRLLDQPVHLDKAIEMVGFGKFHYYLLFVCGTLCIAAAMSLTSVSFIIPSAQCDLEMSSFKKGLLNGTVMIGMLTGTFIWGYVADSKGRRFTLVVCLFMDGLFNLLSSVSQFYSFYILCRLLSGFGLSGYTTLFSYLVEFLNVKYREKFSAWMELFWSIGMILLPCVAWIIIPHTFRIEYDYFLFRSWNLFVMICSLPSILVACLLFKMPESPKFLLSQGKHNETVDCLKFVYRWNNNESDDKFPVTSIIVPDSIQKSNKSFFGGLCKSVVRLFTSEFKVIAIITCIMHFCTTTSYYMLVLWFPELMNRFRWYETLNADSQNKTTMCEIMSVYKTKPEVKDALCNDHIDWSVYMNIIIVGIACIPTSLIVPLLIKKFGLKFFTVTSFFGSGLSAAWLYFITSSTENLVLSSVFEALSSTGINLIYCITVELFPTEYRGMATSIGTMFGKIGALMGNILIGMFIDAYCIIPIIVSCSFLIISGILVFTLPKTR